MQCAQSALSPLSFSLFTFPSLSSSLLCEFRPIPNTLLARAEHPWCEATENFVKHIFQKEGGTKLDTHHENIKLMPSHDTQENIKLMSSHGQTTEDIKLMPSHGAHESINPDAIIHKGQGIEHALIRQIEHDPKMAQELGFKGNVSDTKALHAFAQHQAHIVAIKEGYVDNAGHEVRITEGDKVGYELSMKDGHPVVIEKTVDGKVLGTYDSENRYAFGKNPENQYEKEFTATHHELTPDNHAPENSVPTNEANVSKPLFPRPELYDKKSLHIDKLGIEKKEWFPRSYHPGQNSEPIEEARRRAMEIATKHELTQEEIYKRMIAKGAIPMGGEPLHTGDVIRQNDTEIRITGTGEAGRNFSWNPAGGMSDHTQHFQGISTAQSDYLNNHPEVVFGNHFHLTGAQLIQANETYQHNLDHLFPGEQVNNWQNVRDLKLRDILNSTKFENDPENHPTMVYIHKLIDTTGLKPKTGWYKPESVESYVRRALQKATEEGRLEQVKMDYIK